MSSFFSKRVFLILIIAIAIIGLAILLSKDDTSDSRGTSYSEGSSEETAQVQENVQIQAPESDDIRSEEKKEHDLLSGLGRYTDVSGLRPSAFSQVVGHVIEDSFQLSPNSRFVTFMVGVGGGNGIYVYDTSNQTVHAVGPIEGEKKTAVWRDDSTLDVSGTGAFGCDVIPCNTTYYRSVSSDTPWEITVLDN